MMKYHITPSEDQSYIVLKVTGEINGKAMMKYIIEAHAMGKELGTSHYLVDVTEARNTDTPLSNYNFAYKDMKTSKGIDPYARVAALVSPGDHSHDFIETVLSNAGLYLKIFHDRSEAIKYLK